MEEECALVRVVSIKETALGCLKEHHKQTLFTTFIALPPAEKEAFVNGTTRNEKCVGQGEGRKRWGQGYDNLN